MRRPGSPILLIAVALLAAACSDDSPSPKTTTSTTASPTITVATTATILEPTTTTTEPVASLIALRGDGLGVVAFGAAPDAAIAAVSAALGEPTADGGWSSFSNDSYCPGGRVRVVKWGGLWLLFTDGDTTYGTGQHLYSWWVHGAPPALSTRRGLGFGATATDAEDLYPGQVVTVPPEDPVPGMLRIQAEGGDIVAYFDAADSISSLGAGLVCGD